MIKVMIDEFPCNEAPKCPKRNERQRISKEVGAKAAMEKVFASNLAVGVNYAPASVDMFVSPFQKKRIASPDIPVQATRDSTSTRLHAGTTINADPNSTEKNHKPAENTLKSATRPKREKKQKAAALDKTRVRYNMNAVPLVQRNLEFLHDFRERGISQTTHSVRAGFGGRRRVSASKKRNDVRSDCASAFIDDSSVVWVPKLRSDWEDCLSELTAVCTSASFRRHIKAIGSGTPKPFYAPLSREYIRDRIDIDDPIRGFQIRHKTGGWLQGFILWTNFTTWTHYFKWDSSDPKSGLKDSGDRKIDFEAKLSAELEAQPRSGDPLTAGVVWDTIAEISLLGGLGCGEYLLRMAIDDMKATGEHKFVVLQATDSSRSFYEKFGFVRVGAVSKYGWTEAPPGTRRDVTPPATKQRSSGTPLARAEVIGYRHWAYANETASRLSKHGGPSYMMALSISGENETDLSSRLSFLERMKREITEDKPKIFYLGNITSAVSSTYSKKSRKESFSRSATGESPLDGLVPPLLDTSGKIEPGKAAGRKRKRRAASPVPQPSELFTPGSAHLSNSAVLPNTSVSTKQQGSRKVKRRKLSRIASNAEMKAKLMLPPVDGQTMSYAQKQYHSKWLAVPPKNESTSHRKPPKERHLFVSLEKIRGPPEKSASLPVNKSSRVAYVASAKDQNITEKKKRQVVSIETMHVGRLPRKGKWPDKKEVGAKEVPKQHKKRLLQKQDTTLVSRGDPNKTYFYNKVVKERALRGPPADPLYFFVLNYDEPSKTLRIVPLVKRGTFKGKREGRTKWQIDDSVTDENIRTIPSSEVEIVPHYTVTKTASLLKESWDILV